MQQQRQQEIVSDSLAIPSPYMAYKVVPYWSMHLSDFFT